MRRSSIEVNDPNLPPLKKMLKVLEELVTFRGLKQPSIASKINKCLAELQQIYQQLDEESKTQIRDLLIIKNEALITALEKKGSKIARPLELAGHIHEDIAKDLKAFIKSNPNIPAMKMTAVPTHQETLDDAIAFSTVYIKEDAANSDALKDPLAHAGRQLDNNIYVSSLFNPADSNEADAPAKPAVEALLILSKAYFNKQKITAETKPDRFDDFYEDTLIQQVNQLKKCLQPLKELKLDRANKLFLTAVISKIENISLDDRKGSIEMIEKMVANMREPFLQTIQEAVKAAPAVTPRGHFSKPKK